MWFPTRQQAQRGLIRPQQVFISLFLADSSEPRYNTDGIDVFEEDWDNLIILDACRYDLFKTRSTLPGELEKRISRGAGTPEWLRGNVGGRDLRDTVYVTANPMYHKYEDELGATFHDVWNLWQDEWGWDSKLQTVPPETTAAYARKAAEEYRNKRLLIHFNQPHGPLLGPTAEQSIIGPGAKPTHERTFLEDLRHRMKIIQVSTTEFRRAYAETFDLVQDAVAELLPDLSGRTVVSADHGEMMGERVWPVMTRDFSHHQGYYKKPLVTVPWLVHTNGDRPTIQKEEPIEITHDSAPTTRQKVNDRLQDLGYLPR